MIPLTAEERAELRRLAEKGHGISPWRTITLLDALDEATARAERYEAVLREIGCENWCACGRGSACALARAALAAEHDTKEDGDGE